MQRKRYKIEGWNQPNGAGFGWASCSDAKAELFFVFENGISVGRQFKTRGEAESWTAEQTVADAA